MTYQVMENGAVRDATADEIAEILARAAQSAVPVVPSEVSRRRGLQALLLERGITESAVETAITSHLDGIERDLALIEFTTSQTFERYRPLVIQMGALLGLDLDALFIKAASLP